MREWYELLSFPSILKLKRLGVVVRQEVSRTTTTGIKSEGLFQDLQLSVHIHKRFGREITVKYDIDRHISECTLVNETRIEEGNR